LTAGQNLVSALGQVASELRHSHPVLSKELTIVHRQAELHSMETALQQWADRVQVPEVSNLAMLLIQSERLGTDTAATLTEMANNFRATARQRAESQANRTSFWMLFPSVFCFWVAAAIMLIGPAYLEFFDYRQRNNTQNSESTRRSLERANRRSNPRVPEQP
jgi:pilus assembly protein TadC